MEMKPQFDDNGQPLLDSKGEHKSQAYVALAIAKGSEKAWWDTSWGAKIAKAGQDGWPAGEWQRPDFSWKVADGDSRIPNKAGRVPADKEGWAGHWILKLTTHYPIDCYVNGNHNQKVMRAETFKRGDYIRVVFTTLGNAPSKSPGVYINLRCAELIRAGQEIFGAGSIDAHSILGSNAPILPSNALIDTSIAPISSGTGVQQNPNLMVAPAQSGMNTPSAPVVPSVMQTSTAMGAFAAEKMGGSFQPDLSFLIVDGKQYTESQLLGFGWTPEMISNQKATQR
jgi:hypothetical protein